MSLFDPQILQESNKFIHLACRKQQPLNTHALDVLKELKIRKLK